MASTTRVPRFVFLVSIVLLIASSCSSEPTSEIEPTSTTSTEAEQAEVVAGDQTESVVPPISGGFSWTEVLTVSDGFVGSVAMTDRGYYAVSRDYAEGFYTPSRVWKSSDGFEWAEIGDEAFGPDANVHSLVAGGPGLIAAGFVPDGGTYSATVWTSDDGSSWRSQPLGYTVPEPDEAFHISILGLDALAAGPDHGLVAGVQHEGLDWGAAHAAVTSALPPGIADLPDDRVQTSPGSVMVRVGPFIVFSSTYEDLGIDSAVADAFADVQGPSTEELFVFGSPDLEEWTTIDSATLTTSTAVFVSELVWSGSTYVTSVWGHGPGDLLVSDDGTTWDDAVLPSDVQDLTGLYTWGDGLIGEAWAGEARILLTSADGREWSKLGPLPGMVGTLGAGDLGIVAEGWGDEGGWCSPETMEPTVVETAEGSLVAGRSTLTITAPSGEVVLEQQSRIADPMWSEELALPEGAVVDYDARTVTFVADGEELMTVTFDELESAYRKACETSPGCCPIPTTPLGSSLYFSLDGLEWTNQDVADTPITGALTGISVGSEHAILTTIGESDAGLTSHLWLGTPMPTGAAPVEMPPSLEVPEAAMDGVSPSGDVVFSLPPGVTPRSLATSEVASVVIAVPHGIGPLDQSRAWRSEDGVEWDELDSSAFGIGASVEDVVVGGPGFVAVGTVPDDDTTVAMAWTSPDALTWTSAPLGVALEPTTDPHTQTALHYTSIVAGPDGAVVMADQYTGLAWHLLEPAVAEALPEGMRDTDRMMIDPDRVEVIWGPFVVFSERTEDLDVDQAVFDAYRQSVAMGGDHGAWAFTTDDFVSWTATQVEESYWSVAPAGDGYLATTWSHGASCTMRESSDGVSWQDAPCPDGALELFQVTGGPDVLAATGSTTSGRTLWMSEDGGISWEPMGTLPGTAHEVSIGGAGIASSGESGEEEWLPLDMRDPIVMEVDGYELTIGPGDDGFEVRDEDGNVVVTDTLSMESFHQEGYELPPSLVLGAASETLTVVDRSGIEHVTITVDQLEDATCGLGGLCMMGPPSSVMWFSTDGLHWSEDSFEELVGYDAFAWHRLIAISDETVTVAPMPTDDEEAAAIWVGTAGP